MIKSKNLCKILCVAGIAAMLVIGCSKKSDLEPLRLPTAEEAIDTFNKDNLENNMTDMARLYSDAYVDYTGYDLATIEKALNQSRKDVEITVSELVSMEDYSDNIKKATVKITAVTDGQETTENYDYAVIKEEEGWAVSPDGIISSQDYDIPMYTDGELNLRLAKNTKLFEGGVIRVKVYNDSKNQYMFGTDDNKSEIVVETSTGTYTTVMDEPTKLDKNVNSYFLARLTNLDGDISKVTVTNIYTLDKDGNIIEDSRQDIIVYQK